VVRVAAVGAGLALVMAGCGGKSEKPKAAAGNNQSQCDELVKAPSTKALAAPAAARSAQTGRTTDVRARAIPAAMPRKALATTTITFVAAIYNPTTEGYWKRLVEAFEAQHPDVKVKVQMLDWQNINQQVSTMVSTKQYPDVLNLDSFSTYAANDLLYPAAEIASPEVQADFIESFAKDGIHNGTQYGMPFIGSTRAFFYNKDILAKAGVAAPPKTWAELVDAAKKIKAAGYIGYGLPLGAEDAHGEFSMWMWGNGGDWKTGDAFTIDSPQNIQTMQFLNCLANVYEVTEPNPGKTVRKEVFEQFGQGKIGMVTGASFLPTVLKGAKSTVQYGVSTVPTHGHDPVTLGVQDYLMAFKKAGNKEAVSKFVNFFYQQDNYVRFCDEEGFLPVTLSGVDALKADADFAPFLDLLVNARFYPQTDPKWTNTVAALKNQLGTAVQPGGDPAKVLKGIQATATGG
jgi:multiple sugar transport system substrate-binding protein